MNVLATYYPLFLTLAGALIIWGMNYLWKATRLYANREIEKRISDMEQKQVADALALRTILEKEAARVQSEMSLRDQRISRAEEYCGQTKQMVSFIIEKLKETHS